MKVGNILNFHELISRCLKLEDFSWSAEPLNVDYQALFLVVSKKPLKRLSIKLNSLKSLEKYSFPELANLADLNELDLTLGSTKSSPNTAISFSSFKDMIQSLNKLEKIRINIQGANKPDVDTL